MVAKTLVEPLFADQRVIAVEVRTRGLDRDHIESEQPVLTGRLQGDLITDCQRVPADSVDRPFVGAVGVGCPAATIGVP